MFTHNKREVYHKYIQFFTSLDTPFVSSIVASTCLNEPRFTISTLTLLIPLSSSRPRPTPRRARRLTASLSNCPELLRFLYYCALNCCSRDTVYRGFLIASENLRSKTSESLTRPSFSDHEPPLSNHKSHNLPQSLCAFLSSDQQITNVPQTYNILFVFR